MKQHRFPNKILIIILSFVICVLSSCILSLCQLIKWLNDDWLTKNQKEITDEAMLRICKAIETHNAKAVKAEFSLYDISEVEYFDDSVLKLFDYIKGENLKIKRITSGSDGALMGTYPRAREFGGVRYNIKTTTDEYKVVFGYCSYYSESLNKTTKERMGFQYFDIINVKNDRECGDRYYTGSPFNNNGIHFDYKTTYIFCPEEYDFKMAFCDKSEDFDPIIINSVDGLEKFYVNHKEEYSLEKREDGKGYKDIIKNYDDSFFVTHSLYITGAFHENGGYKYYPQFLYIGDFVMTSICKFEYETHYGEYEGEFATKGVIIFVELPEKVPDDIEVIGEIYDSNDRA